MPQIPTVRIVVAGDKGTGKSCLVNFFLRALYLSDFDPDLEETYNKQVRIDDKHYNLEVVDTVDDEFRSIEKRNSLYQDCDVIILTYAINDIESFNNLYYRYSALPFNKEDGKKRLSCVNNRIICFPPIILVGTKVDLESERQVDSEVSRQFVSTFNLQHFFECSSLTNINIDELFRFAIDLGLEYQRSDNDLTHLYLDDEESHVKPAKSIKSRYSVSTNIYNLNKGDTNVATQGHGFDTANNGGTNDTQNKSLKPMVTSISMKNTEKNQQKSSNQPKPEKPSDSCCSIM